jgi:hypothetical protein
MRSVAVDFYSGASLRSGGRGEARLARHTNRDARTPELLVLLVAHNLTRRVLAPHCHRGGSGEEFGYSPAQE